MDSMTKALFTNPIHVNNGLDLGFFCNSENFEITTGKEGATYGGEDGNSFTQPDLTFFDEMVRKLVEDNSSLNLDHTNLEYGGKVSGDDSVDSSMSLLNTLNDSGFSSKYFSNIWSPTEEDQVIADVPSFLTTSPPSSHLAKVSSSPMLGSIDISNNVGGANPTPEPLINSVKCESAGRLYNRVPMVEAEGGAVNKLTRQHHQTQVGDYISTFNNNSYSTISMIDLHHNCATFGENPEPSSSAKSHKLLSLPPPTLPLHYTDLYSQNGSMMVGKAILGSSRKALQPPSTTKALLENQLLHSRPLLGSSGGIGSYKHHQYQQQAASYLTQSNPPHVVGINNFNRLHMPPQHLPSLNAMHLNHQPFFPPPNLNQMGPPMANPYMAAPPHFSSLYGAASITGQNGNSALSAIYRQNTKKTKSGIALQFHLEECFAQFKSLEKERKKCEAELARKYPGKNLCSTNNINMPMLSSNPSRVDRMIVDHWKEHSRVMTLLSKMQNLHSQYFPRGMADKMEIWVNSIRIVQDKRREEIETGQINRFNINAIKGMPIMGQMNSPKKFQDDKDILVLSTAIKDLGRATKIVRSTLWTALTLTVEHKNTAKAMEDLKNLKNQLITLKMQGSGFNGMYCPYYETSTSGMLFSQANEFHQNFGKPIKAQMDYSHTFLNEEALKGNGYHFQRALASTFKLTV